MRVIGYVRVSTDEQRSSGAGLAAQRAAIEAECRRRGWHLVEIIEDAGYSAKDLKRPGVQVALETLQRGEAGALVIAKLDRLSRSMLDFTALMAKATKQVLNQTLHSGRRYLDSRLVLAMVRNVGVGTRSLPRRQEVTRVSRLAARSI